VKKILVVVDASSSSSSGALDINTSAMKLKEKKVVLMEEK
jgi:hypothetical protein